MMTPESIRRSIESSRRLARVCVVVALFGVAMGAAPLPPRLVNLGMVMTAVCAIVGLLGAAHFSSVARARERELGALREGILQRDLTTRE